MRVLTELFLDEQPPIGGPLQRGIVHFDSQPRGANIYIDGVILVDPDTEESVKTPATVALIEGRRNFTMTLRGHKDVSGYADVLVGTTVNIFKNLEPGPSEEGRGQPESQINLNDGLDNSDAFPPLSSQYRVGTLTIYSDPPGATIYIDGNTIVDESCNIIPTPVTVTDIPEGMHEIQLALEGYYRKKIFPHIIAGQTTDINTVLRWTY